MERVFISAGSNLGDRQANLERALVTLDMKGVLLKKRSSLFETEPVGFRDQPWFLNMAVEVETYMPALDLLKVCHEIENAHGRVRTFRGAPRSLDLDILFYGDRVIHTDGLRIPHPRLTERRFVLEPLAEIAPEFVHPLLGESVRRLLEVCPDIAVVRPFNRGDVPR
ncbi:MAG: 2-amino-4-hydroxy-6-hydroxymethyldihydropteridine diphosphokinase [Acidobacteria bacterium]|nr:2-amino-4-hydroxy-6-hydroxymethyldihydropteridine diphosphokinase [Acidobacteriota bacterium]